jgi:crotonobetainyl-CoA:carnitine CoA-transferase CaiB-like acyl-CoA transferase
LTPLSGITVVSIEQAVAAPLATRHLADLGARVIKIERPDGGDFARGYDASVRGLSSYFVWLNRSKASLAIDLKRPEAAEVLARLVARADVVVSNLAPGAAARLGAGAAELLARHPRLIVCEISGYGTTGPFAERRAYDLLVQNEAGLVSITGAEAAPSRAGISVADIAAGMYACAGTLAALYERRTSGRGRLVSVSLFDALAEWMSAPAYYTAYGGSPPPRTGGAHATIAPYEGFTTSDGVGLCIAVQNPREWTRLCEDVLGQPDLAGEARFRTNPLRVRHRDELHAIISRVLGAMPFADAVRRLDAAGIAWGRQNSVQAFVDHPQLAARDRWREIGSPAGPLRALAPPASLDGIEPVMGAVPALGEHTAAILDELGYGPDTIAAWRQRGTIACP